jgi:hypothetical protein
MEFMPIRRKLLLLGLTCGFALALAPAAFADTVNLTRFSKTVSGIAPTGATSVTVDLLRNTVDANGNAVRQQVDTFTAPVPCASPCTAGQWSGSFATHAFSTGSDQVEVNYTGVPAETQVTIGGGKFLPTAGTSPANEVSLPAYAMDGCFGIASDGSDLEDQCTSKPFNVTINGTAVAGGPFTNTLPLATHVSNADAVVITQATTSGPTTVNLTDSAPLLTPIPVGQTGPQTNSMDEARCGAFLHQRGCVPEPRPGVVHALAGAGRHHHRDGDAHGASSARGIADQH